MRSLSSAVPVVGLADSQVDACLLDGVPDTLGREWQVDVVNTERAKSVDDGILDRWYGTDAA